MSKAMDDVLTERMRQINIEGWTAAHDDEHDAGELASAGACYAVNAACVLYPLNGTPIGNIEDCAVWWPFGKAWWKPKEPRRDLVKAAALIIAEIERLDRTEGKS